MIQNEIAAYESEKERLETSLLGRWVVFHNEEMAGDYEDFQEAAKAAVEQFGDGPYLIRQVGTAPVETLPALLIGG